MAESKAQAGLLDECTVLRALRDVPEIIAAADAGLGDELAVQKRLRESYPDQLVSAAFALAELRRKARGRFSRAAQMWFDRRGLEQATCEAVARHKARRFQGEVYDLCCGLGGDTLALGAHSDVTAFDLNAAALLRAQWNCEAYGVSARGGFVCRDVTGLNLRGQLVHIDPDRRRANARRAVRLEDYTPAIDFLSRLPEICRGGAIKLSPAASFAGRFPNAEIELVSLEGECKEATVWFGELAAPQAWCATVLPAGETISGNPLDFGSEPSPVLGYLFDPDPAVVRSGLVDAVATRLGLARLDRREEYLTGPRAVFSPFVQTFEVLADLPNNTREIRRAFRGSSFGQVEIKCRHLPVDASACRRGLPLPGADPAVLVFARVSDRARALICRRVAQ